MIFRYSGIETAHRCLRKYKLDYIDQLPQVGATNIDLSFGTGMHMAIQACLEGEDPHIAFRTYWDSEIALRLTEGYRHKDLQTKATAFLSKFDRLHKRHLAPAYLEKHLTAAIRGLQFEGTADFLGDYQGMPSVIDWKTSAYPYLKEKILSNPQMPLYAEMARLQLGYEAKQLVYYVFVKASASIQVMTQPYTDKLREQALDTCVLKAKELEGLKEFPRSFTACQVGRSICSRFSTCYPIDTPQE